MRSDICDNHARNRQISTENELLKEKESHNRLKVGKNNNEWRNDAPFNKRDKIKKAR